MAPLDLARSVYWEQIATGVAASSAALTPGSSPLIQSARVCHSWSPNGSPKWLGRIFISGQIMWKQCIVEAKILRRGRDSNPRSVSRSAVIESTCAVDRAMSILLQRCDHIIVFGSVIVLSSWQLVVDGHDLPRCNITSGSRRLSEPGASSDV